MTNFKPVDSKLKEEGQRFSIAATEPAHGGIAKTNCIVTPWHSTDSLWGFVIGFVCAHIQTEGKVQRSSYISAVT